MIRPTNNFLCLSWTVYILSFKYFTASDSEIKLRSVTSPRAYRSLQNTFANLQQKNQFVNALRGVATVLEDLNWRMWRPCNWLFQSSQNEVISWPRTTVNKHMFGLDTDPLRCIGFIHVLPDKQTSPDRVPPPLNKILRYTFHTTYFLNITGSDFNRMSELVVYIN